MWLASRAYPILFWNKASSLSWHPPAGGCASWHILSREISFIWSLARLHTTCSVLTFIMLLARYIALCYLPQTSSSYYGDESQSVIPYETLLFHTVSFHLQTFLSLFLGNQMCKVRVHVCSVAFNFLAWGNFFFFLQVPDPIILCFDDITLILVNGYDVIDAVNSFIGLLSRVQLPCFT